MLALALLAAAAPALAPNGTVHVVAPFGGDFADIQSAVNAAAGGDLILIKAGTYAGFQVNSKALTITADLGQAVQVNNQATVQGLDAGETVILAGLSIGGTGGSGPALVLSANDGNVQIERCNLVASGLPVFFPAVGADITSSDAVNFTECTISAITANSGDAGLRAQDSSVSFYECVVTGAKGFGGLPGGAGCQVFGGTFFASGSTFNGGEGGDGTVTGPFMTCSDGGAGGAGLTLSSHPSGDPVARVLDCTLNGGTGGPPGGPACVAGATGLDIEIFAGSVTTIPVAARTYEVPSPVREGVPVTLSFHGLAGELVFLLVSLDQTPLFNPLFQGVFVPANPFFLVFVGAIPPSGTLSVAPTVNLGASLECAVLHEQAIYFTLPTGWVLGSPRPSIVLDSSF